MAIYKIFPSKDASIYSLYPYKNTGLDAILDTSLYINLQPDPVPQVSRFLTQFSSDEITDVINNKISGSQWDSYLICFSAHAEALTSDITLEINTVSQNWNMGTGKFLNNPQTENGVSWIAKDYSGSANVWTNGTFDPGTTGSYSPLVHTGGGTWYTSSLLTVTQSFGFYSSKDINVKVTDIVDTWASGTFPNYGFIIKQKDEFIDSIYFQPKLSYFSVDTNTIYPPQLEFRWDDHIINTGSSNLPILNILPLFVSIGNNPGTFAPGSINKFRVFSRPEFPARVFSTSSYYTQNYYLPEESYYAIKDLDTNEFVINFDNVYTKLSADSTSNYFTLYMNGLEPERYYKILVKTIINGNTLILDNDYYFKIIYR